MPAVDCIRPVLSLSRTFYGKFEKYFPPTLFILGFVWDALTLRRIDNLFDNLCLLGYLIIIGTVIVLSLRLEGGARFPGWLRSVAPRFPWIMQFCFGGLFSSYVVFYFKSVSFTRTAFFFLVLVGLLIGNEFLEDRLQNRTLLAALYSFCGFSFFAFFMPVVLKAINPRVFVLAGVLGSALSAAVFCLGLCAKNRDWRKAAKQAGTPILAVFLFLNALYFADLIPPVPLALKTGRPYHSVVKKTEGFEVRYVPPSVFRFWRSWDDPFYLTPGDSVYCYTAVFAPGGVQASLLHVWSRATDSGWEETDRMPFSITGGRDGGYRWFSKKKNVRPGRWRVRVETAAGQILGRIDFTIKEADEPHTLRTELIP